MKNKKLLLIPLVALLLGACQPIAINPPTSLNNKSSATSSAISSKADSSNNDVSSSLSNSSSASSLKPSSQPASSSQSSSQSSFKSSSSASSSSQQPSSSAAPSSNQPSSSSNQPSSSLNSSSASSSSTPPPSSSASSVPSSSAISSSTPQSSSVPQEDTIVNLELFALNDFHGNVLDSDTGLGISRTSTLLKTYPNNADNALYISQGDMWQGSAKSNITRGQLVNDWMNQIGFTSMTMGNHEFDWNSSYVRTNANSANFPYLGINIFDRSTNQRVDYLDASTIINKNGAKIGIIGAIGDCYSSISASNVTDIYFKVGDELTNLVKNEAIRLKDEERCDFVIYSLHEDDANYDIELSDYVDLVLEGHTHQNYVKTDARGVYHIQSAGYNKTINYINLDLNITQDTFVVNHIKSIYTNDYDYLEKDNNAESLFEKYADLINSADDIIGFNSAYRNSNYLRQLVADLYLDYGMRKWGSTYNVFLGGGFISCRSPYKLEAGPVTYSDLYTLFPFDNHLVLCSIEGYYLYYKFVNTDNANYFISYSDYGRTYQDDIDFDATYYVITDTYSSDYASNNLTVIERYTTDNFFARDMLKEYIIAGNLE